MEIRITRQVDPDPEAYHGNIVRRRSRGKKKWISFQVTIPGNFGMFTEIENQALQQNAVHTVERLIKLVGLLNNPPTTSRAARWLQRKTLDYFRVIFFLYFSTYHNICDFHHGESVLNLDTEEDFGSIGDTHVRELVAEFADLLIQDLIIQIPGIGIEVEDLEDWNSYYAP